MPSHADPPIREPLTHLSLALLARTIQRVSLCHAAITGFSKNFRQPLHAWYHNCDAKISTIWTILIGSFTLDDALHMHQTGTVGSGDIFGPGFHMMPYFITPIQTETACSSTANIPPKPQHSSIYDSVQNFNTIDQLKQVAQFIKIRDIQFARSRQESSRTPWQLLWMLTLCGKRASSLSGFITSWIIAEIINLTGTFAQMSFFGKDARMIQFDKCHTTTRRPNNVIILLEQIIEP